jgi:phosphopantetheinyl transferase
MTVPARLPVHVIARWLGQLSTRRAAVLARGLRAGQGLERLTGMALLAHAARRLSLPPLSLLTDEPGRKPRWPTGPDFSIAHGAGIAACAVAPPGIAIGVDLERIGDVELGSLRLVTSSAERMRVKAGEFNAAALWTGKEAVLKAAGTGVLAAARVEIDSAVGHHAGRDYHLARLDLGGDILLSIATTTAIEVPAVNWLAPSMLFDDLPVVGSCRSKA